MKRPSVLSQISSRKTDGSALVFMVQTKTPGNEIIRRLPPSIWVKKGLKGTSVLNRAIDAYASTKLTDPCYETKGRYYSEFEIPAFGQNIIRCACIARASYTDVLDISPQIDLALESFRRVTEVDSIYDVSRPSKKRRLFNQGGKMALQISA